MTQGEAKGQNIPLEGMGGNGRGDLESSSLCSWASQLMLVVRNQSASVGDAGDLGSIPGSGDPLEK